MSFQPFFRKTAGLLLFLSLLSSYLSLASGKVYHIKPSSTDVCPAKFESCVTLPEIADHDVSRYSSFGLNTTLIFLSGKHSLKSVLSISNISTFSINSRSSTITCDSFGRFDISNVHAVRVSNLTFVGCTGNKVESVTEFTLEYSNFLGTGGDAIAGTALELVNTTATLSQNNFFSYRGKQHSMRRVVQGYPSSPAQIVAGGAILSTTSNIIITESSFEGNSAGIGGAIFSEFNSNVTLINSVFKGNFANRPDLGYDYIPGGGVLNAADGGAVTIHNCQFINNSAIGGGKCERVHQPQSI